MSQPAIIVTPCTPVPSPFINNDLEKSPYAYATAHLRYLTPPTHSNNMERRSTAQRIQRRVQLVAAVLALLLSAMAFASLIHPAIRVKPAATAIEEHASSFFSSLRVGLGDHLELRSMPDSSSNARLVARKLRRNEKRSDQLWKMPRVNASPAAAEPVREAEPEVEAKTPVFVAEEVAPAVQETQAQTFNSAEAPKIKSIRAVQAQLMREAKARMHKRQEFVRKQQMGARE